MWTEDSLCASYGWFSTRCTLKTPYVCHMVVIVLYVHWRLLMCVIWLVWYQMCTEDFLCVSYGWFSIRCALKTSYVSHEICTEDSLFVSYCWCSIRCALKTPYMCHMVSVVSDVHWRRIDYLAQFFLAQYRPQSRKIATFNYSISDWNIFSGRFCKQARYQVSQA